MPMSVSSNYFSIFNCIRIFDGATCSESLRGFAWSFYAIFGIALSGVVMFTLRSALYPTKAVHNEDMREDLDGIDEKIDWEEFANNQIDSDSVWTGNNSNGADPAKKKRNSDNETHITYAVDNIGDEERGVEVNYCDSDSLPYSPTAQSNQSSIDTNECFDEDNVDDGVNSFNSELEPLTPSPTSMNTGKDVNGGTPSAPEPSAPEAFTFYKYTSPDVSKKPRKPKSRREDDTSIL